MGAGRARRGGPGRGRRRRTAGRRRGGQRLAPAALGQPALAELRCGRGRSAALLRRDRGARRGRLGRGGRLVRSRCLGRLRGNGASGATGSAGSRWEAWRGADSDGVRRDAWRGPAGRVSDSGTVSGTTGRSGSRTSGRDSVTSCCGMSTTTLVPPRADGRNDTFSPCLRARQPTTASPRRVPDSDIRSRESAETAASARRSAVSPITRPLSSTLTTTPVCVSST